MKNLKLMRTNGKGIQAYVNYLLEDIQQAEGKADELNFVREKSDLLDHFMEMERIVLEDPLNTFGEICGLTTEQFPPIEKLTKKQIQKIVKAFHRLLQSWNLAVVVPKKLPDTERYKIIGQLLDRKVHIIKNGTVYIEFCSYEEETCPFGTYCDCKELMGDRIKPVKKKRTRKTKSPSQ